MPALKAAVTADATGYCAYTPNLPGDCLSSAKGSWPLTARESFTTIDDCQWRCTQCRNCNFVSASEKHGECQWYKECRVADLQVSELGLAYRTRQVSVHTPHSATDQPGAWQPNESAANPTNLAPAHAERLLRLRLWQPRRLGARTIHGRVRGALRGMRALPFLLLQPDESALRVVSTL